MLSTQSRVTEPVTRASQPALKLGVEQEFDLFDGQRRLDFQALFPRLIAGGRCVPFRNSESAVILEAGYMLGCDGQEAEIATAPISLHAAGPLRLAREVTRCRGHMLALLQRAGVPEVRGYSTHLSISVPAGRERELAEALSVTVAPALVLLMESRSSPGMLLRTRRGRLEIGSEYIDDEQQLAAAAVFLAGSVHAFLYDEETWRQFPRLRLVRWEEATIRPGIYLPRDAYGESIHDLGRLANLELQDGGTLDAGALLEICTRLVLRELEGIVQQEAFDALEHAAHQPGSLQIERDADPSFIAPRAAHSAVPEAETLTLLARGGHRRLMPRFVDWEGAAFAWRQAGRELVLGMPWDHLPALFSAARDNNIRALMPVGQAPQPVLNSLDQLQEPQTFRAIQPAALGTQAVGDKGAGGGKGGGKGGAKPPAQLTPRKPTPWLRRFPWLPAILIFVFLIGGGIFIRDRYTRPPVRTETATLRGVPALPEDPLEPACLPPPALVYPPNAAKLPTDIYTLRWSSSVPLPQGSEFAVLASSDPNTLSDAGNSDAALVGTSHANELLLDFNAWEFRGHSGEFFWKVRIRDANGAFMDCGDGGAGTFSLVPAEKPGRRPGENGPACDTNGILGCP